MNIGNKYSSKSTKILEKFQREISFLNLSKIPLNDFMILDSFMTIFQTFQSEVALQVGENVS